MFATFALPGAQMQGIRPDTRSSKWVDGRIKVADGSAKLAYRFYPLPSGSRKATAPIIVHFHGNAEVGTVR